MDEKRIAERKFLISPDGLLVVEVFNRIVPQHSEITDLKKVDFILWKTRPE